MKCTFCGTEATETAIRRSDNRKTPVCDDCVRDCRRYKDTWTVPSKTPRTTGKQK